MAKRHSTSAETPNREETVAAALHRLADEVQLLRMALDELREDFQWAVCNPTETGPRVRITSVAADPMAPDFGERINAIPAEELDRLREEAVRESCERSDVTPRRPASGVGDT